MSGTLILAIRPVDIIPGTDAGMEAPIPSTLPMCHSIHDPDADVLDAIKLVVVAEILLKLKAELPPMLI